MTQRFRRLKTGCASTKLVGALNGPSLTATL